jgi:hypothetical protein
VFLRAAGTDSGREVHIAMELHDRLKAARIDQGEALASVAQRTGVAERLLRAIEDGRFSDLPRGIYARAAIRSYAVAFGLEPAEILAACDALLPVVDDPISTMARLRGVRPPKAPASSVEPAAPPSDADGRPDWRLPAAAALDAVLIGAMLAVVMGSTRIMAGAPAGALTGSAAAFGLVGLLLAGSYFVWLGGLMGTTAGRRSVRIPPSPDPCRPLRLRAIATRAIRYATDEGRFIRDLGVWLGRMSTSTSTTTGGPYRAHEPFAEPYQRLR